MYILYWNKFEIKIEYGFTDSIFDRSHLNFSSDIINFYVNLRLFF